MVVKNLLLEKLIHQKLLSEIFFGDTFYSSISRTILSQPWRFIYPKATSHFLKPCCVPFICSYNVFTYWDTVMSLVDMNFCQIIFFFFFLEEVNYCPSKVDFSSWFTTLAICCVVYLIAFEGHFGGSPV